MAANLLKSPFMQTLKASYRKACGIHKYGLYYEDCLIETPVVDEALRRLPEDQLIARDQRLKQAFDLSFKKIYLPPELRSDTVKNTYYLTKLRDEVQQEFDEREEFRQ